MSYNLVVCVQMAVYNLAYHIRCHRTTMAQMGIDVYEDCDATSDEDHPRYRYDTKS